jgi:hypothetical protein
VLALNAAPEEVDLMFATELVEADRAVAAGYVTPTGRRSSPPQRVFTVDEKAAMGDGRLDARAMGDGRLDARAMADLARRFARRAVIADFAGVAARADAPLTVRRAASAARGAPRPGGRGAGRDHCRHPARRRARLRRRAAGAGRGGPT